MKNTISVFEFGKEYECVEGYDVDFNDSIMTIKNDNIILGEIIGLNIPDIDDLDAMEYFNEQVIAWVIYNKHF